MNANLLLDYFRQRQSDMLQEIEILVNFESPSTDKALLDTLALHLQERFRSIDTETKIITDSQSGNHVEVVFRQNKTTHEARPVLLLCHFDTVWPVGTAAARPFRVEGKHAWGPGILDMKASIVLVEFVLRAIQEFHLELPRPIWLFLNSDEEISSPVSRLLIEERARQSKYVLVLEPPLVEGRLKTTRKGVGRFIMTITGRASHAGGEAEKGASAVAEMALQILALQELANSAEGTTVNVGVAQGGTRPNVVAATAQLEVDVRVWTPSEACRIEEAIHQLQPRTEGVSLQVTGKFTRPPMVRSAANVALFQQARQIGAELGMSLTEGASGGGSDGSFCAALGIPTLDGLGVLGEGAHAEHEQIIIDSLPRRAALLTLLLLKLKA